MSIQYPYSIGKVHKIFRFETVFHDSASDCTKLTLVNGACYTGLKKADFLAIARHRSLLKLQ